MVLVKGCISAGLDRFGCARKSATGNNEKNKNATMVTIVGLNLATWLSVGLIIANEYCQAFFFGVLEPAASLYFNETNTTMMDVIVPVIDIKVAFSYGFDMCIVAALIDFVIVLLYAKMIPGGLGDFVTPYFVGSSPSTRTVGKVGVGDLVGTMIRACYQLTGTILTTLLVLWTLASPDWERALLWTTVWIIFQEYLVVTREMVRTVQSRTFKVSEGNSGTNLVYLLGIKVDTPYMAFFNMTVLPFLSIYILTCIDITKPYAVQIAANAAAVPVVDSKNVILNVLFLRLPFLLLYAHTVPALYQLIKQLSDVGASFGDMAVNLLDKLAEGDDGSEKEDMWKTVEVAVKNTGGNYKSGAEFEKKGLVAPESSSLRRGSAVDGFVL